MTPNNNDNRPEFKGKIADVIGELVEMMRQEKLMYELRSTMVGLVALFGRTCTARSTPPPQPHAYSAFGGARRSRSGGGAASQHPQQQELVPAFPIAARCFEELAAEVPGTRPGILVPLASERNCVDVQTAV